WKLIFMMKTGRWSMKTILVQGTNRRPDYIAYRPISVLLWGEDLILRRVLNMPLPVLKVLSPSKVLIITDRASIPRRRGFFYMTKIYLPPSRVLIPNGKIGPLNRV